MSMWSDREDAMAEQRRNDEAANIGNQIRSLPEHKQHDAMEILQKAGIDADEAMHQSARNHWDKHW